MQGGGGGFSGQQNQQQGGNFGSHQQAQQSSRLGPEPRRAGRGEQWLGTAILTSRNSRRQCAPHRGGQAPHRLIAPGTGGSTWQSRKSQAARRRGCLSIDPGACTILEHRFPDAPNIGDMTALDWNEVPPVDVLCGGTPCQDLSAAGRRAA